MAQGKIEERVGHLTNDSKLETEGIDEKIVGRVRRRVGQVEKVIEKA